MVYRDSFRKLKHLCISLFMALSLSMAYGFSEKDIISPASGSWRNKQALVLDVSDESEVYYSFSGSDPLASGFSYDGPVLIDQTGLITLNLTAVSKEGLRSDYKIVYSVEAPVISSVNEEEILFINNISNYPIIKVPAGTPFVIPQGFRYCIGNDMKPDNSGKPIYTHQDNIFNRYMPCTLTDGSNYWHFVLHTVPSQVSSFYTRTVPFEFVDWNTLVFTGNGLIYQVDEEFWSASRTPVTLDRSIPHVIRWQSMAYEQGNPVQSFVIPVKPDLVQSQSQGSYVAFSLATQDADFKICPAVSAGGTVAPALFRSFIFDTFDGDCINGSLRVAVYYDGVYQGVLESEFEVDKKPPKAPVISSSSVDDFARNKVSLSILGENDASVYYAVSAPLESETAFADVSEDVFDSVSVGPYTLYSGQDIILRSNTTKASFYKVCAYAQDFSGNVSPVTEYNVVVDEYNYYLAGVGAVLNLGDGNHGSSSTSFSPGSYQNPFTSFEDALYAINSSSSVQLHVSGTVNLTGGLYEINSKCSIIGNNARFVMNGDSSLSIQNADVSFKNIILEKTTAESRGKQSASKLISAKNSILEFYGCELLGIYEGNAILVETVLSDVDVINSGLTVQSSGYGCNLSCAGGKVNVAGSRLTSVAPMAVNVSLSSCILSMTESSLYSIGDMIRSVELMGSTGLVKGNLFSGKQTGTAKKLQAFWSDESSVIQDFSDNDTVGF